MKDLNYVNEFNMPVNTTKRQRSDVTSVGEIDECECFFYKTIPMMGHFTYYISVNVYNKTFSISRSL